MYRFTMMYKLHDRRNVTNHKYIRQAADFVLNKMKISGFSAHLPRCNVPQLKDHFKHLIRRRTVMLQVAIEVILQQRRRLWQSELLLGVANRLCYHSLECCSHTQCVRHIRKICWWDVLFNMIDFLSSFHITKEIFQKVWNLYHGQRANTQPVSIITRRTRCWQHL